MIEMVKPCSGDGNRQNTPGNRLKKPRISGGDGGFQKTLFQCWKKNNDSRQLETDDIEIIEIKKLPPESNSAPKSRPISANISNDFKRSNTANGLIGNRQRRCPFYKRVGDAPYTVDAFNYVHEEEIQGYFLSHFHSDHYVGLGTRFKYPIYCSEITANLVRLKFKLPEILIHALPLDASTSLADGTRVQLLNSNHCPGAVLFVFRLNSGRVVVHTGDMRADESLVRSSMPLFRNSSPVDALYLDTTYCNPRYVFPSQSEIIDELKRKVESELRRCSRLLIVVGAYAIGKERVFKSISDQLNVKIFVQKEKWNVLRCLDDPELDRKLTLDPNETPLHVVSMGALNCQTLTEYLDGFKTKYDAILGICATGWEYGRSGTGLRITRYGNTTVIGAPYSEHSSYSELKRFVQLIRPRRIIPTVNVGNENTRKRMQDIFAAWLTEDGRGEFYKQQRMGSFLTDSISIEDW